jgi:exonuclease III
VDKKERYTDWWDKDTNCVATTDEYSMIDHILMTNRLYNAISNVTYYHGYKEYCGKYDTDHFPILVDFDVSLL